MTDTVRLATRGSDLALRQATQIRDALSSRRREVELVTVETRGDDIRDELIHRLGTTGAFVHALDEEVVDGTVDAAVHSLKDIPTEDRDELAVAGVPQRAPAGDVLLTPDGLSLDELPEEARVGTSSLRRRAQLLAARPDLTVVPLRGNVDTRIEKLLAPTLQSEHEARLEAAGGLPDADGNTNETDTDGDSASPARDTSTQTAGDGATGDGDGDGGGDSDDSAFEQSVEEWFDSLTELEREALGRDVEEVYDGIVLAESGLRRSDLLDIPGSRRLERSQFVPAPGQGTIAVTACDPGITETIRTAVDHPRTRVETTAERTVLGELGGGCVAPMGVHAVMKGEYVHLRTRVQSGDGSREVADTRDLRVGEYADEAAQFAADLADRGAAELIAEAQEVADD
ncbi:MAG: porphobilinogen deaminase [Halorubrum sp. J07HR59]|nr:MAG: porphobilinogen deaminase [Halorubrum sp. J07HR59]